MNISDAMDILTVIISIVGVSVIIWQLKLINEINAADHLRRKKEATLNAWNAIRVELMQKDSSIRKKLSLARDEPLSDEHIEQIVSQESLTLKVRILLSFVQRFGVGSQHDVYDIELLWNLAGTPLVRLFDSYLPYVESVRETFPTFVIEAEEFVEDLRRISDKLLNR
jgi:hypothetical protein